MKEKFKKEFKRQLRMAIAAAIGFTIAFSWKEFVLEITKDWIANISQISGINIVNFYSALAITFIGVLLIIVSSRMLE
jgi:hypothetical protein